MLDIKFLRENPEVVKQNIRNKFQDQKLPLVDEVIESGCRKQEQHQNRKQMRFVQRRNKLIQTNRTADGTGQERRSRGR